jgi:hypothetical protein
MSDQWKPVTVGETDITERLRVPGGWIYRVMWRLGSPAVMDSQRDLAMAMCFVPIPPGMARAGD